MGAHSPGPSSLNTHNLKIWSTR